MARYKDAIRWIALNDEPRETDLEVIASQISVLLVADVFKESPQEVAADVCKLRRAREALRENIYSCGRIVIR